MNLYEEQLKNIKSSKSIIEKVFIENKKGISNLNNSLYVKKSEENLKKLGNIGWCGPLNLDAYYDGNISNDFVIEFLMKNDMANLKSEVHALINNLKKHNEDYYQEWSIDVQKIFNDFYNDHTKKSYLIDSFFVLLEGLLYRCQKYNIKGNLIINHDGINKSKKEKYKFSKEKMSDYEYEKILDQRLNSFELNFLTAAEIMYKKFEEATFTRNTVLHGKNNPGDIGTAFFLKVILLCRAASENLG